MENNSLNRLFQTAGEQKKQQGTGFTNLNRIMSANQNNQLGQKVAGNIQNQIGNVKSSLQSQQQQFQTEAEKNRLDSEQNKQERQAVLGRFTSPSSNTQDVNEDEIKKFQQFRTGAYAGPQGLKDTASLGSTAQELASQTSNLSPSGTSELLRRTVGGGRYTQGQQKLDTLLMDRSKLQGAARQAGGLSAEIARASGAAQAQAEQYKNLAKQFATETEQQLQSGVSGIDAQVQAELNAAKELENQRLANIQAIKDFAAGRRARTTDLTSDEIAQGFTKDSQGRVVNKYGELQYDTNVRGGAKTKEEELDYLAGLLRSKGANEGEVSKLLGVSGNKTELEKLNKNYQQALDRDYVNRMAQMLDTSWGSEFNNNTQYGDFYRQIFGRDSNKVRGMTKQQLENYVRDQINQNAGLKQKRTTSGNNIGYDFAYNVQNDEKFKEQNKEYLDSLKQTAINNVLSLANRGDLAGINEYNAAKEASRKRELYDPRGVLGEAIYSNKGDQAYNALANTLANSQAAQGLTKAGVASEPLRTSYSALEKLLGKQQSELTLKPDAERYQAGKFLINPDLIRKTF